MSESNKSDLAAIVGVLVIGVVGVAALWLGKESGSTVAGAAVGGIAGWLARSGMKTANVTADTANIQPDAGQ